MAEYLLRHEIVKGKDGGSISGNYLVISRALSSDYEPEGSPASAQGVTVSQNLIHKIVSHIYFFFFFFLRF